MGGPGEIRSLTGSDLGLGIESIMSLVPGFDPRHRQILFVWNLSRARGGRCFGVGWGGGPWRIRSGQGKIRSNFHLFRFSRSRGRAVSSVQHLNLKIDTSDDQRFFFFGTSSEQDMILTT